MKVFDVSIKELNNNLDHIRYEIVIDNQKIISGWYKFRHLLNWYINGDGHYGIISNKDIRKFKTDIEIILDINHFVSFFITKEGGKIIKKQIEQMYMKV